MNTDESGFGPKDDYFHFNEMSERWWETETAWFAFCVPERKLGGWLYTHVRPNIGAVAGGAWVWDHTASLPWEVLYSTNYSVMRLRHGNDLNGQTLPNGVSVAVLSPLTSYKLGYKDGERFQADLTFDAVMPPRALRKKNSSFGSLNHFDQFGRVRGHLVVLGEKIPVDCLAMRDRSWGPRPEHRPNQSAYVTGIANEKLAFLAVTDTHSNSSNVSYGFFTRDGVTHDLVEGTRSVVYNAVHGWAEKVEIRARDEQGRELHAVGRRISGIVLNRHTFIDHNGLIEWSINGEAGYGEDQDLWPIAKWADHRRGKTLPSV
jgi:hypothetical protein